MHVTSQHTLQSVELHFPIFDTCTLASNAIACATCHKIIKTAYSIALLADEPANVVGQKKIKLQDRFALSVRF